TAMTATVTAVTPAAIKPQLVAQLKVVQASSDFADVASVDVDAIALAINVAQQAAAIFTQAVTGTPTPAPPPPANPFECVPDGWWSGKIGGAMMAGVVVAFWGWGKHVGRKKNSARLTMAEVHKVATFTSSETAILALAMVDAEFAAPGTEVTLLWGEPDGGTSKPTVERHVQTEIKAIVSSVPYSEAARDNYADGWRTKNA
ncbi:MAG: hypothetical protein OSA39_15115, partial [Sphingobium sp.]|nr:hypothetical protein [Sphingobium sp.]